MNNLKKISKDKINNKFVNAFSSFGAKQIIW